MKCIVSSGTPFFAPQGLCNLINHLFYQLRLQIIRGDVKKGDLPQVDAYLDAALARMKELRVLTRGTFGGFGSI